MTSVAVQEKPFAFRELTIYEWMDAFRHFECQQNPKELEAMIALVKGKKSYLEIGANFGGTLWRMGKELSAPSKIVCVDLPERHQLLNPLPSLEFNCTRLANLGHTVELFPMDSHRKDVRERVRAMGPFDFGFIDGDHSYEGVKQDWYDYGPMCKIVAFHDICGATDGCVRFWQELKASIPFRTEEYDFPYTSELNSQKMHLGIGVVFREE